MNSNPNVDIMSTQNTEPSAPKPARLKVVAANDGESFAPLITFTVVKEGNGSIQSKHHTLKDDGTLETVQPKFPTSGTFRVVRDTLDNFPAYFKDGSAAVLGVPKGSKVGDVVGLTLKDKPKPGAIARTKDYFEWVENESVLLFDVDRKDDFCFPPMGGKFEFPELCKLLSETLEIPPEVVNGVAFLGCPSSSAGICLADGTLMKDSTNRHYYAKIKGASPSEALNFIYKRGVILGYGSALIHTDGKVAIRIPIDECVAAPERLDYAADPVLGPGLIRKAKPAKFRPGKSLDLTDVRLKLSDEEEERFEETKDKLKNAPEVLALRAVRIKAYVEKETKRLIKAGAPAKQAAAEAEAQGKRMLESPNGEILDIYPKDNRTFCFADGRDVSIVDILSSPSAFHGKDLADPLYTDNRRGAARFFHNPAIESGEFEPGRPEQFIINSKRGGGRRFFLHATDPIEGGVEVDEMDVDILDGEVSDKGSTGSDVGEDIDVNRLMESLVSFAGNEDAPVSVDPRPIKSRQRIADAVAQIKVRDCDRGDVLASDIYAAAFSGVLKYVVANDEWVFWDGRCWVSASCLQADELAKRVGSAIMDEYSRRFTALSERLIDKGAKKNEAEVSARRALSPLHMFARRVNARAGVTAMIDLAKSDPSLAVSNFAEFNADPFLLNVGNGILNLRTGVLSPHTPEALMSQLAPVNYNPDAKCPRWLKFLNEIMLGDEETIKTLQQWVGYSLTGDMSLELVAFYYGGGANGKSVFIEVTSHIAGEYSVAGAKTLLVSPKSEGNAPRSDIIATINARMVDINETDDRAILDESTVKNLASPDKMSARDLYSKQVTFKPQAKVSVRTQYLPVIKGTDNGIWRRVLPIEFKACFLGREDFNLAATLKDQEAEGILAWAVQGTMAIYSGDDEKKGLFISQAVIDCRAGYRKESDLVGQFLDDYDPTNMTVAEALPLVERRDHRMDMATLYSEYRTWCYSAGTHPWSQTALSRELTVRKIGRKRANGKTYIYIKKKTHEREK